MSSDDDSHYPEWAHFNAWITFTHACVRMPSWFGGTDWHFVIHTLNPWWEEGEPTEIIVFGSGETVDLALAVLRREMKKWLTDPRFTCSLPGRGPGAMGRGRGEGGG